MRKFIVFVIISVLSFGAYALTEAELWRLLNTEYKIGPGKEEARQGQAFARDYDIPEDLGRRLVASFSISDVHLPSLIQQVLDIINQKEGRKTNQREDGRAQQREEKFASDASKKGGDRAFSHPKEPDHHQQQAYERAEEERARRRHATSQGEPGNPILHPKMAAPHILEGDSYNLVVKEPHYSETPFQSSHVYGDLKGIQEKLKKRIAEEGDLDKRARLQKILETTEISLIRLSLEDRHAYLVRNKLQKKKAQAHNSFHPLNTLTAAEKSGALLWAHRNGILGQGVDTVVIEKTGFISPLSSLGKIIKETEKGTIERYNIDDVYHAEAVASVLYQMAPQASITLIKNNMLQIFFDPEWRESAFDKIRTMKIFEDHPLILNFSGGLFYEGGTGGLKGFFDSRKEKGDLLVKAVPNSVGGRFREKDEELDHVFNKEIFNAYPSQIILVGNIDSYGNLIVKPFNDLQSRRFLCAYGEDILVREDKAQSGTSFATPTVSGAAALVKSKYPQLTLVQIGDLLLASAEKTFWIWGRQPTLVYDPEDFPKGLTSSVLNLPQEVTVTPFDPMKYGQGILNLRRAFLYADIAAEHPDQKIADLAPLFKKRLQDQENEAARKIQIAFLAYKKRKQGK